eukprot:TRINITY_DN12061_c0_g1_i1.p1 TRINITY_DN12061_c0_g1~~TRINITY_DN12061_c0_g1_i1.p1  ORF type:complete len:596 (-),score=92.00 TRINITY_DN12061_c0_g1_i1:218-2005(-)
MLFGRKVLVDNAPLVQVSTNLPPHFQPSKEPNLHQQASNIYDTKPPTYSTGDQMQYYYVSSDPATPSGFADAGNINHRKRDFSEYEEQHEEVGQNFDPDSDLGASEDAPTPKRRKVSTPNSKLGRKPNASDEEEAKMRPVRESLAQKLNAAFPIAIRHKVVDRFGILTECKLAPRIVDFYGWIDGVIYKNAAIRRQIADGRDAGGNVLAGCEAFCVIDGQLKWHDLETLINRTHRTGEQRWEHQIESRLPIFASDEVRDEMLCISPHLQEAATAEESNARESVRAISELLPICCGTSDEEIGVLTSVSVYEHRYDRSVIFISFEGAVNGKICESNHELASYFHTSGGKTADFWKDLCVYGALNGSQPDWHPMRSFISPLVACGAAVFDCIFKPMIPKRADTSIRTLMSSPKLLLPQTIVSGASSSSPTKPLITKRSINLIIQHQVPTPSAKVYVAGQDTPFVPLRGLQDLALIYADAARDEKLKKRLSILSVDLELPAEAGYIADKTIELLRDKFICRALEEYANEHNARMVTHLAFFVIYGWLAMLLEAPTQEPNLLTLAKILNDFDISTPRYLIRDVSRVLCDKRNIGEIIID